jgi:hypothetical protein
MLFAEDIKEAVDKLKDRVAQLEQENATLRAVQGSGERIGVT